MVGAGRVDRARKWRWRAAMPAAAMLAASVAVLAPDARGHTFTPPYSTYEAETGDLAFIDGPELAGTGEVHVVLDSAVGPRRGRTPCRGQRVSILDDLDAVVNRAAAGTRFCLGAGLHRIDAPLVMKDRQHLRGIGGTVISGARVVEGWLPGNLPGQWIADWPFEAPREARFPCENGADICNETTDVFVDDLHLPRVSSRRDVEGRSSFIDHARQQVVIGIDPTDRTVEVSRPLRFGIADRSERYGAPAADDVVIDNLVIEKIGTRAQHGAIDSKSSWRVTDVEVRSVHGVGIRGPVGLASRVERAYVHDIGQLGMGGTRLDAGYGSFAPVYYLGNEITRTNYARYRESWEAGGAKWTQLNGLVVRDNFVHDAAHVGIWVDVNARNALVERNLVTDNETRGIFFEISCNAWILDNTVRNNGSANQDDKMRNAGILIADSGDPDATTVVSGNIVDRNGDGIGLIQSRRTEQRGRCSTAQMIGDGQTEYVHRLQNVLVIDNDITLLDGDDSHTGIGSYVGDAGVGSHRFEANRYRVVDPADTHFELDGGLVDFATWSSSGRQEDGGSVESYLPSAPCDSAIQDAPEVSLRTSVAGDTDHEIWVRMRSPDRYNNSVLLAVDGACPVIVGDDALETTPGVWQWMRASPPSGDAAFELSSGTHDIHLVRREEGVAIDKVAIVRAGSGCRPESTSVNCADPDG